MVNNYRINLENKKKMKGVIMEKLIILNSENVETSVNAIRYFKYRNDYFLIFSYDEIDTNGKQKLYIVQILDELGGKVARNINDLDEWNDIQIMIKEAIKQIKNGSDDNIEKLDIAELNNIKIENPREFKIDPKLVKLLSLDINDNNLEKNSDLMENLELVTEKEKLVNNDKVSKDKLDENKENVVESTENAGNSMSAETEIVDYKKMYLALKEDNDATEELLNDLMSKLSLYKEKYGELSQE